MFGGFKKHRLVLKDCDIFFVENGKGTPVVLLHGFPQTHAMWANVAPLLSNAITLFALTYADMVNQLSH